MTSTAAAFIGPEKPKHLLALDTEDIVNGAVWRGFRIYRPENLQFELFGNCSNTECLLLTQESCDACIRGRENRSIFFGQRCMSVMMYRPRLMRKFFPAEPMIVPYLTVLAAYYILIKYMDRLFDPTNKTLHKGDKNWNAWIELMDERRVVAHHIFLKRYETYAQQCLDSSYDRLKLINSFERFVCFSLCLMEAMNQLGDGDVTQMVREIKEEVGEGDKGSRLSSFLNTLGSMDKQMTHTFLARRLEVCTEPTCPADNYDQLHLMEMVYNKMMEKILAEEEKEAAEASGDQTKVPGEPESEAELVQAITNATV